MSRCWYFKLDLTGFLFMHSEVTRFSSMHTVGRDYDQFFKCKSSLIRYLVLVNLLYSQDSRVIQVMGLLTWFMVFLYLNLIQMLISIHIRIKIIILVESSNLKFIFFVYYAFKLLIGCIIILTLT